MDLGLKLGIYSPLAIGHFQRNDKGMKPRISKALADHGISWWFYLCTMCEKDQKLDCILLVDGLEHLFIFPYIGNVIIPTDKLNHFSEG